MSQLIRFARACSHVKGFNERNLVITSKILQQGYRYHKFRKYFTKFYHRNFELISKFKMDLKTILRLDIVL